MSSSEINPSIGKELITPKEYMSYRINNASLIRKLLKHLEPCIQPSSAFVGNLTLLNEYEEEMISFKKELGSGSAYGEAYLAKIKGHFEKIAIKLMEITDNHTNEIMLLKKMSKLVEKGIAINLPITFHTMKCTNMIDTLIKTKKATTLMIDGNYYVILNELAYGDMNKFFDITHTTQEYESCLLQMIFAVQTFHQLNYTHNDAHLGNFLWHRIPSGGYWQYEFRDTKIYVPNMGHLIVLWDPGLAKSFVKYEYLYQDFINFMHYFSTVLDYQHKKVYNKTHPLCTLISIIREGLIYKNTLLKDKKGIPDKDAEKDLIIELINMIQKRNHITSIYTDETLPPESIILNEKPYPLEF